MTYSISQWLVFFFIYCFIGWIWECSYVSIRTKKLTNRGFIRGPFLPIYGSGALVMLYFGMPLKGNIPLMFLAGAFSATVMEYITGETMEYIFKVRYWDYSKCFLNVRGHICFKATMAWGTFTVIMNYLLHPPVERLILTIPENVLNVIAGFLVIYFTADFSLAFKTAMDLRDVLIAMEKLKEEAERIEKRIDVVIAFAEDSKEQAKEKLIASIEDKIDELRLEDRIERIEELIAKRKEMIDELEEKKDEMLDSLLEINIANALLRQKFKDTIKTKGMLYRDMIRMNPVTSRKFKHSLEEIKEKVEEYYRKK